MRVKRRSSVKFNADLYARIGIRSDQAREEGRKQTQKEERELARKQVEQTRKEERELARKQVEQARKEERDLARKQLEQDHNRTALIALAKGIPLADVAEMTGLTTEQIKRLRSGEKRGKR
jgi:hypothetical protein